jgi:hypothetical protein
VSNLCLGLTNAAATETVPGGALQVDRAVVAAAAGHVAAAAAGHVVVAAAADHAAADRNHLI